MFQFENLKKLVDELEMNNKKMTDSNTSLMVNNRQLCNRVKYFVEAYYDHLENLIRLHFENKSIVQ